MEYLQSKHIAQRNSFAALFCVTRQFLARVGSGSLAKTSFLGHKGARSKCPPMILGIEDHLGKAFHCCNETAFDSFLVVIVMLLVNIIRLFVRGIPLLSVAWVILDLEGLTGEFPAVCFRKASTSVYVFTILAFAALFCVTRQFLARVGSGSLAKTSFLGHKGARSKCPPMILGIEDHLGNATGRCRSARSTMKYQQYKHIAELNRWQYKHIAERNSTSEQEPFVRVIIVLLLTGAFAAVSYRKAVYVFTVLAFAALFCVTRQVLVRVGSGSLARTYSLGHEGARSKCPLMIMRILDHLGNATGRCSESAEAAADEATWLVDSGASHHVTGNRSRLLNGGYLPVHGEVVVVYPTNGGEVPLRVRGIGSVRTGSIVLDDVWYVPGLDLNLVSTGQLVRQGCAVTLGPGGCRITRAGALVGSARFTEACHFQLDFLKLAGSE